MAIVACVVPVLGAAGEEGDALGPPGGGGPNVLIVVTDDQRVGSMGVMPRTKNIFSQGVSFKRAYATTPLCCPSRASIFTGRYPHNHKVKDTESAHLLRHDTTLEHYLHKEGYTTAVVGKYLNMWDVQKDPPFFDRWTIFNDEYGRDGYRNERWNADGQVRTIEGYTTSVIRNISIQYLNAFNNDDDRPWLMYVFPFAPHAPYDAEKKYAGAPVGPWKPSPAVNERDISDKPPWVKKLQVSRSEASETRRGQLRTLMSVDDLMDRVFDRLIQLGEADDTLIFYLSDNGITWGEHGVVTKRNPYLPSIKVPLFMRWAGMDPAAIDTHRPVANIDIAPTVLDAAGVNEDPEIPMDGRSLLSQWDRNRMHLEHSQELAIGTWASTLQDKLQYTEFYGKNGGITFRELYRLNSDPHQLRNVLKDGDPSNNPSRKRLQALSDRLASDRKCKASTCP
jgi:arylsulfatase A-like enzyme